MGFAGGPAIAAPRAISLSTFHCTSGPASCWEEPQACQSAQSYVRSLNERQSRQVSHLENCCQVLQEPWAKSINFPFAGFGLRPVKESLWGLDLAKLLVLGSIMHLEQEGN